MPGKGWVWLIGAIAPLGLDLVACDDAETSVDVSSTGGGAVLASSSVTTSAVGGGPAGGAGGTGGCAPRGNAPAEVWALRFGGPNDNEQWDAAGWRVAPRPGGGAVVTGAFGGVVGFGNETFDAQGGKSAFVVAVDAMGAIEWVRAFGTQMPSNLVVNDLAADEMGVTLVGSVDQPIDFGDGLLTPQGVDAFVVKLDTAGNLSWSYLWSDISDDNPRALTLLADGDAVIVGNFDYPNDPGYPMASFAWRFDASGNNAWWTFLAGGIWTSIARAPNDLLVIGAHFEGEWPFTLEPSAGMNDVAVLLSSVLSGGHVSSQRFGYSGNELSRAVSAWSDGMVIAGTFTGTTSLGFGAMQSQGAEDVYLAKLTPQLVPIWALALGGDGADDVVAVGHDASGDVWLAGNFVGTASFGGEPFVARGQDAFMALVDASGQPLWSAAFGGPEGDMLWDGAMGEGDDVIVTGSFRGCIDFGNGPLLSEGQSDAFLAKLSAP